MTAKISKIPASDDAWESGALGREEEFAKAAEESDEKEVNEALQLQLISLRLQKGLIDDFKFIAERNGIGYQTLMRQSLTRFAVCEMKKIAREMSAELSSLSKLGTQKKYA